MQNPYLTLSPDTLFHLLLLERILYKKIDALEALRPLTDLSGWRFEVQDIVLDCMAVPKCQDLPSPDITKEPDIIVYSRDLFHTTFEEIDATAKSIHAFLGMVNQEVLSIDPANLVEPTIILEREHALALVVLEHLKWRQLVRDWKAAGVEITWADSIDLLSIVYQELGQQYSPSAKAQAEESIKTPTLEESRKYIEWVKESALAHQL